MSFKSVRDAAEQLKSELGSSGLDVLCNNAGIMGFGDKATEDGCDVQMQTNHLSHFLLTCLCIFGRLSEDVFLVRVLAGKPAGSC